MIRAAKGPTSLRLHIKNNRSGEEVFRITPERLEQALARHPGLSGRLEVSLAWDLDDFETHMAEAEGLVTWDLPTKRLRDLAPRLRWIHIIGAGIEHLQPLDWLPQGVVLTNSKGVHAPKAREYAAMALAMLNARLPSLVTQQKEHRYEALFTGRIAGKTLLVVGAGHMGAAVAEAGKSLGLKVLGIRKSGKPRPGLDSIHYFDSIPKFDSIHGPNELESLLGLADFVVLTVPLLPETKGLMNAARFALCKPGAGLINMSRGPVVDQKALCEALDSGQLSGAILDVTDPEPLPADADLWDQPHLIVTPHVSSDDRDDYAALVLDLVLTNVARDLAGQALLNRVDPKAGY